MTSINIPIQLTSFIGRERDMAEVQSLLSRVRQVTLTGVGGCGKTRLAIQVANAISEAYKDGVWWVDMAPMQDPSLIPQFVVHTFGLRPVADQPMMASLLSFVRLKHMLLVLDNCEHLNDACAQLARQLLTGAPDLRILTTSREALANAGETLYSMSGLTC